MVNKIEDAIYLFKNPTRIIWNRWISQQKNLFLMAKMRMYSKRRSRQKKYYTVSRGGTRL